MSLKKGVGNKTHCWDNIVTTGILTLFMKRLASNHDNEKTQR